MIYLHGKERPIVSRFYYAAFVRSAFFGVKIRKNYSFAGKGTSCNGKTRSGTYSVEIIAKKMIRLYDWILNGGEKPEFVFY
jgi:hypothetical protein